MTLVIHKYMIKKILSTILGTAFLLFTGVDATQAQDTTVINVSKQIRPLRTIIIDPGHGYPDGGAEGRYSKESDIALGIALKLFKKFQDSLPGVKVLMTRTDQNLPNGLKNKNAANRWRAQFANENHGDLFLCIHVNDRDPVYHTEQIDTRTETYYTGKGRKKKKHIRSIPVYRHWTTPSPVAGTETYVWAIGKNDSKTEFVRGSQDTGEMSGEKDDSTSSYFDSPEAKIEASIRTKKYFDRSRLLATYVEDEFVKQGRNSRGVKQRNNEGIWVLQATAMPSILVETGFIGAEEDYLNSNDGQDQISSAILHAVLRYKQLLGNAAGASNVNITTPNQ